MSDLQATTLSRSDGSHERKRLKQTIASSNRPFYNGDFMSEKPEFDEPVFAQDSSGLLKDTDYVEMQRFAFLGSHLPPEKESDRGPLEIGPVGT